jgi:uncharacterized protein YheU (UPF0270 family)
MELKKMDNILEEASAVLLCKTCQWYKNCVTPIRLSPEELQNQIKSFIGRSGTQDNADESIRILFENAASSLQNVVLEGCPVFIKRLRASPKLAQTIKQLMLTWGSDEMPQDRKTS